MTTCLECGDDVPVRSKSCGGNQPGFCTEACRRARRKKTYREWFEANRARELAKLAERIKAYTEKYPDYFREYYAKHRERRRCESRAWYRSDPGRHAERQKAYNARHPEQVRAAGRRSANKRRAIKKHVFVETVDPRTVFDRDKGICGICLKSVEVTSNWEIDHVIPISKGGPHSYVNVQLSHRRCNRAKWASVPTGVP